MYCNLTQFLNILSGFLPQILKLPTYLLFYSDKALFRIKKVQPNLQRRTLPSLCLVLDLIAIHTYCVQQPLHNHDTQVSCSCYESSRHVIKSFHDKVKILLEGGHYYFVLLKGQLISKCLFGVFSFLQKTNQNNSI